MREAIDSLDQVARSWSSSETREITEVDWTRMRSLNFQEVLQSRNEIEKRLQNKTCTLCANFDTHVSTCHLLFGQKLTPTQYEILHGEKVLKHNLVNLRLAISDQNLELIPDYEQRVEVLKELNFIDENSTVQLKGRVACEVSRQLCFSRRSHADDTGRSTQRTSWF